MLEEFPLKPKICILSIHPLGDNRINKYINSFLSQGYEVVDIHFYGNEFKEKNGEIQFPVSIHKIKRRLAFFFKSRILNYIRNILNSNERIIFHIHDPIVLNLSRDLKKKYKLSNIVYDRHESYEYYKTMNIFKEDYFYEKINKKHINMIIVVNEEMKTSIEKYYCGINIIIVGNMPLRKDTVDERESYIHEKNQMLTISYIGNALSLFGDRDMRLILELSDIIKKEGIDYRFYIAGKIFDGRLLEEFMAREDETNRKFRYLGIIPRKEAIKYTKKSHIGFFFLRPAWNTPCSPNKVYDYILYGVIPILRFNIPRDFNISAYTDYYYSFDDDKEKIRMDFTELIRDRKLIDSKIKILLSKEYNFYWENDMEKIFQLFQEFY
jgi:hypothetical protein